MSHLDLHQTLYAPAKYTQRITQLLASNENSDYLYFIQV